MAAAPIHIELDADPDRNGYRVGSLIEHALSQLRQCGDSASASANAALLGTKPLKFDIEYFIDGMTDAYGVKVGGRMTLKVARKLQLAAVSTELNPMARFGCRMVISIGE